MRLRALAVVLLGLVCGLPPAACSDDAAAPPASRPATDSDVTLVSGEEPFTEGVPTMVLPEP